VTPSSHDVVVIGGGVTGAGVARDLARRGASVLLLEKGDYGAGTSGGSSMMIHGGPRYLEFDWRTTRLSSEDAGKIVEIARHMVHRVVFLLPVLPGDRIDIERLETAMEVYDRYQPLKHSHRHVRLTRDEALRLEPGLSGAIVGALTMEEWGVDPFRLCWLNVLDALEHGAQAHNHAVVTELVRDGTRVAGVRYRLADGSTREARARIVVNATGPWASATARLAGVNVRLRPAKGVHIVYDRRITNFAISAEAVDGRGLLVVPHGDFTLVGTTDDDFYGDPDHLEVLTDEVDYILQAVDRVIPSLRQHRATRTTAGIRPTLYEWRPNEDDLSRRHELIDHEPRDGVAGFLTITGGKLSMYRLMAEATADAVCAKLGIEARCTTGIAPLPGSESAGESPEVLGRDCGVPALVAARVKTRHGCRSQSVLGNVKRGTQALICRCQAITEAELAHAAEHEHVATLGDAFHRVGLAAGPCSGALCLEGGADVLGRSHGWNWRQRREAAEDMRRALWKGRTPVLDETGWAQEELVRGAHAPLRPIQPRS
jgi:glycerol-3-phosphate dehydrogenase